jgi:AcrR family transcriptional regulator
MAVTRSDVTPNRRGARSREAVLDAAERVMAEQGYAGASINAIVDEAGIPISSVYHYFGSKDGVLLAVMERGSERFFAEIPEPVERIGTPLEHLTVTAQTAAAGLEQHPDFLKLVIVMAAQPPAGEAAHAHEVVTRVREFALERLRKQLGLAFERDPRSAIVDRLARYSLALVDGAFVAHQADEKVSLASLVEMLPAALVAIEADLSV